MSDEYSDWQGYWAKKQSRFVYDLIAEFYRRVIIRPSLNRFVKKYFKKNERILHAGCGSGQVDTGIHTHINIVALDIAPNALEMYKKENGLHAETILGNIFAMPFEAGYFDGIYNLGVMEHFSAEDIKNILKEFRRVVKLDGKIILFWPPTYGLSVIFFKLLTRCLYVLTRKTYAFHPAEICQLESKAHARALLEGSGFQLIEYAFGPRDIFTYVVLVAKAI